ncbi:MAG TPA: hypothetical protein PLB02_09765 [Thermoanaerobaculia bacterium]|nr:hypothetical protein [Thermoanaerobaculia bacterium]
MHVGDTVTIAGEAAAPDASLVSRAVGLGARAATFVTVSRPVCSSREKGDLASRFRVPGSAPAVVDMESAAWGRAAAGRGVPFLLLRAVSDTLGEDLPGFLASSLSADGSVDRAAVARRLLFRPAALPALLRMRRRVREGSGGLARFLARLIPEMI